MDVIAALWGTAQLGELCSITTGDKDVNEGSPSGEFPFFTCAQEISKSNSYSFDGEAILIAGNGNFSVKKYKGKFEAYQRTYVLQNFKISPAYLYYFISHRLSEITKDNRGSTIRYIRIGNLTDYDVAFPCEQAQHRIVAKIEELFSELDKGIENLKIAREQLKVYRQALLKHAFEGKLTAQWRAANPDKLESAASLLARIQTEREQRYRQQLQQWEASGGSLVQRAGKPKAPKPLPPLTAEELAELPELPEGWVYTRVGALIDDPTYGTSKKCDYEVGGLGVLRIPNVISGKVDASDLKFAQFTSDEIATYKLSVGDILIIRSNGSVSIVGKCALVSDADVDYLYAGYLIRLRPHLRLVDPGFLLNSFSLHSIRKQIEQKAKSTSGVNNINTGEIQSLVVALCGIEEQKRIQMEIEARLSETDQLDQTLATSLQQAEALRQSILKKAFSGQLVAQDANDEPAAALLARIRAERAVGAKNAQTAAKPRKSSTGDKLSPVGISPAAMSKES